MEFKGTAINITSGTILRTVLILGLFWLVFYLRDLVLIILTAVVIATAIEPAIKWLSQRKVPRIPAVIILYLIAAIFLVAMVYFLLPPLFGQAIELLERLPADFRSIDLNDLTKGPSLLTNGLPGLNGDSGSFSQVASDIGRAVGNLSGNFIKTTSVIFGGVLSSILIVVLSFYFAVQETGVDDFLRIIVPSRHMDYALGLWKRAQLKIGLWMQGQVLLGLIVGVLVYLWLTIIGVPYAFLLAIIAAIFEIIPVFGPVLSAIPGIAIALTTEGGGLTMGLLALGGYVVIQQFENHLIYPLVVRKVVGVPPIMVIIALIIGAKLAGFLGVVLSVPISAAIKEYLDDIERKKEHERRTLHQHNS
ncbi:MAG: AI-2E family transporter [bacterium]|nr:AI-2E family transporter [bacterium]